MWGRAGELVELPAGLSDVTAAHSYLFLPSGARFLIILARFNDKFLARRRPDRVPSQAVVHGIGVVIHLDSVWE